MSTLSVPGRGSEGIFVRSSNKPKQPTNKFRLTDGERKLPRPIVFWSDNEKDAFRRNKVVQTRYYMLLDDIENQKRSSQRTIRYEAHKFRQRSARIMQDKHVSDSSSYLGSEIMSQSSRNITSQDQDTQDDSGSLTSFGSSEKEAGFWDKAPRKGVITKNRKPTVKFSVYREYIPYEDSHLNVEHKPVDKNIQLRCLSAIQPHNIPDLPMYCTERSKSVLPDVTQNDKVSRANSFSTTSRDLSKLRPIRTAFSSSNTLTSSNDAKKSTVDIKMRTPNKLFFDKSQAAYQLRKELQRLARIRKQSIASSPFSMEQALKDEKEKYIASREKVTEYLQRMDKEKPSEWICNKWNLAEVEQN
ncbi:hypothetical protein KP79_PYT06995 [Mizuhopecten yessoensis]|uniref:Uncharacterized protein n=1 Tax=Mizuhopecten yessoensis TaxID=6573 RepID=A0A210QWW0_MIZYE|nr:hypothetical protein KP79_PYT06995 [Mizuhopecten yessoensis]